LENLGVQWPNLDLLAVGALERAALGAGVLVPLGLLAAWALS